MKTVVRLVRLAVAFEISLYRSLYRWVRRRPDVPAGAGAFSYVGAVSLVLWAFIVGSAIELVVLHVILPWETVRLVADILGVWGLVWMLGLAASYHVYPHVLSAEGLRVRNGSGTDLAVPWDAVASVRSRERSRDSSRAVQVDPGGDGGVLNVVTASRTNIDVSLTRPLVVPLRRGEESVTEVRLFADDPRALVRTARQHLVASGEAPRR